jgi:hypothetical protein
LGEEAVALRADAAAISTAESEPLNHEGTKGTKIERSRK